MRGVPVLVAIVLGGDATGLLAQNAETVTCTRAGGPGGSIAILVIDAGSDPIAIEGMLLTQPLPPAPDPEPGPSAQPGQSARPGQPLASATAPAQS